MPCGRVGSRTLPSARSCRALGIRGPGASAAPAWWRHNAGQQATRSRSAARCLAPVPGTPRGAASRRPVSGTGARHLPGRAHGAWCLAPARCPQARESCGFLGGSGGRRREYWVAESFLCQLWTEAPATVPGRPCGLLWTSRGRRRQALTGDWGDPCPGRRPPPPTARRARGRSHGAPVPAAVSGTGFVRAAAPAARGSSGCSAGGWSSPSAGPTGHGVTAWIPMLGQPGLACSSARDAPVSWNPRRRMPRRGVGVG